MKGPVVVLGSTGQVGLFAISCLLEAGRQVWALTRKTPGESRTAVPGLERFDLAGLSAALDGRDGHARADCDLLSCGPAGLALEVLNLRFKRGSGRWGRAVVIGTTSTESKNDSPDARERATIEHIRTALAAIRQRCGDAETPLTILNPTLIYGCGMDQNLSRVYRWIMRYGFAPISATATGRRQPVHVGDLAATAVRALELQPGPRLETAVCGGTTLEYREMIGMLFDALGRNRRFLNLPAPTFPLVAALSRTIPGSMRVNSEMLRRQSRDLVFDDQVARDRLNHDPRPYSPGRADFEMPIPIERIRRALG